MWHIKAPQLLITEINKKLEKIDFCLFTNTNLICFDLNKLQIIIY